MNLVEDFGDGQIGFDCPGCGLSHVLNVGKDTRPRWSWNGDYACPTITPSVRARWDFGEAREPRCCHLFVRGGSIEFLSDCTHALAGQTVAMQPIERGV